MKFKKGDKVWVYGVSRNLVIPLKMKARIDQIFEDGLLSLTGERLFEPQDEDNSEMDFWDLTVAHPLQCRPRK